MGSPKPMGCTHPAHKSGGTDLYPSAEVRAAVFPCSPLEQRVGEEEWLVLSPNQLTKARWEGGLNPLSGLHGTPSRVCLGGMQGSSSPCQTFLQSRGLG